MIAWLDPYEPIYRKRCITGNAVTKFQMRGNDDECIRQVLQYPRRKAKMSSNIKLDRQQSLPSF